MSISPALQARVQSCGAAILNMKLSGRDIKPNFSNCVFANLRAPDEEYCCLGCGINKPSMFSCSICHAVPYCGVRCQTRDWKERHKYECQAMKEAYDGMRLAGKLTE